jgi:hypothetical protein
MRPEELTENAIDHIVDNMEIASLSAWELSFYESVSDQWKRSHRLSERQKEILGQIWDKQP